MVAHLVTQQRAGGLGLDLLNFIEFQLGVLVRVDERAIGGGEGGAGIHFGGKGTGVIEGDNDLKEAGALVSMAHPRLLHASVAELSELLAVLKPAGLDALEAYHSEHNAGDVRECVELADRFGLQLTGGSDYHGLPKPKIALGSGKGGLRVARHVYDRLMEYRASCGMED